MDTFSDIRIELPKGPESTRADLASNEGSIFFVGTATTVIRYGGFTILTDPNFLHRGDHIHVGYGITSERLTEPAISLRQLGSLDMILVSHTHEDHFDRVAEEQLDRAIPIVTTPQGAKLLHKKGFQVVHGLGTYSSARVIKPGATGLKVTAMPGRHGPRPLVMTRILPAVMGSLLEFGEQSPFRIYISGDTLIHKEFRRIPERVANIHLALLHLGGTKLVGILLTMDAEQGLEAMRILKAQTTIPIHYNDYTLFKSPLAEFQKAVREAGLEKQVHYLRHGDTFRFRYEEQSGIRAAA